MSKTKILVTGSGGFIFSNFIRYVLKNYKDYVVVSIDRCNEHNVLNTIYANKGHTFYIGDVTDSHFVDVIFELEKPDIVIHGAAEPETSASFVRSNVLGTSIIVDSCIKYNSKLIYVSTSKVYGYFDDRNSLWEESDVLNPIDVHSATKAGAELIVQAAGESSNLNYNIIRPCLNFGPRQQKSNFIPNIIANVLDGTKVQMRGDGMNVRDWMHVQDTCNAILTIIEKATNKEVYNISAKQEISNIEIFQKICNSLGKGHDLISHIKDRPEFGFRSAIDNSKLVNLGWKSDWSFSDGLNHTINWYDLNRWFIKA